MSTPADVALPYRTDWRELNSLLDYCKGKGSDRSALEARFGAGESLRETLNALEQLRLIERGEAGDTRLSMLGEQLAYAPDAVRQRQRLTEALLGYAPYRFPLERAVADQLPLLEAAWVEHIWQVDMRLGQPRNRVEEARTFFFRLADEAGLGTYRRGVRGQTTRLELAGDFAERVEQALATLPRAGSRPGAAADVSVRTRVVDSDTARLLSERSADEHVGAARAATPPSGAAGALYDADVAAEGGGQVGVSVRVTVDMTDWELDKIAAFLRLIGHDPAQRDD
jgi:hypothetical protein